MPHSSIAPQINLPTDQSPQLLIRGVRMPHPYLVLVLVLVVAVVLLLGGVFLPVIIVPVALPAVVRRLHSGSRPGTGTMHMKRSVERLARHRGLTLVAEG